MSAPDETRAAAEAAIRVGLPYTYTVSFDTAGRSMMGLAPKDIHGVADGLAESPVAVGANCGVGASDILVLAARHDRGAARRDGDRQGQLRHPGIPRHRDPLFRHAGTDGRLCPPGGRCRREDHRRLLRHLLRASRRHARVRSTATRRQHGRRSRRSSSASARCATSRPARAAPPARPAMHVASAAAHAPDGLAAQACPAGPRNTRSLSARQ